MSYFIYFEIGPIMLKDKLSLHLLNRSHKVCIGVC